MAMQMSDIFADKSTSNSVDGRVAASPEDNELQPPGDSSTAQRINMNEEIQAAATWA
ncbi:GM25855 [Drosophila sechellia]|uniref:GM25855 n=1 Tax=Drosophila sechellia TaxID=7238 RepID=B4IEF2_DROSE|nr:GM25855 [Drosophila sechellia]